MALATAADDPDFILEDVLRDDVLGETIRQYTAYESVPGEQAVDVSWVYEAGRGAQTERTRVKLRYHYFYPHQFDILFGLTSFRLVALHGSHAGTPFTEDSERLIVEGEAV